MNKIFIKGGFLIIEEPTEKLCEKCGTYNSPTFIMLYNQQRYCKTCLEKEYIQPLTKQKKSKQAQHLQEYLIDIKDKE